MGGGDLNMKKSWHPVLLVNQERVWKAEKAANEEKKKLAQLRKEQEEERQLAELQRLQEQATGKKRVEKLDWLYAAPSNEGGALGNAKISQSQMEDYLLGKRRVDEALAGQDKNVGNMDKEFIAVQNANSARDTAAKIREDPLLAIKRQEEAALKALRNRPDIRRQLKAAAAKEQGESKEERRARRKAEKEERRQERHERRRRRGHHDHEDDSPRSDYSDERSGDRAGRRRREDRYRDRDYSPSPRRYSDRRDRDEEPPRRGDRYRDEERYRERGRSRSRSPRRYRDEYDSPPRRRDREEPNRSRSDRRVVDEEELQNGGGSRVNGHSNGHGDQRSHGFEDGRINGHSNGHDNSHSNGQTNGHSRRTHSSRPSALDMADRPTSSRPLVPYNGSAHSQSLDEMRAARLAAMTASATDLQSSRDKSLAMRAEQDRKEAEKDERLRVKYGQDVANAGFFKAQGEMGLGESLQRRGGKGLQRERDF
ncbi:Pre-mRNA splicing factor-domain-containing protein [Kockovaella imperatae]|uniref:Pre-mRNA splicing factor-domain-containing protein n=1 Tax=Kockovaella imperatae TaxID=4999 RepID=A0A1Y1UQ50_9TREE|nr:Pre-mRNA splicing factor-domain-containing protein [Kockovaella imperatae]ORX40153.1 Pre-mRNA splicing factor-domain-containing protein [Kockovaella imperatae]